MELPDKQLLRRGDVVAFLGIDQKAMTKMVRAGTLTARYIGGAGRAYFARTQVVKLADEMKGKTQREFGTQEIRKL
jgi:hypothetical protein